MPESYAVPADLVTAEYSNPGSQPREVVGRCPFLWGQSLYILGKLLQEVFCAPLISMKCGLTFKISIRAFSLSVNLIR